MKNRDSGFTLVELMIGVLLLSLLALVVTQIPLFNLRSWRKGNERLEMQRDAHYAMLRIQRKLRPARLSHIDVSDPSTLVIGDETFFLQETNLFYQNPEGTQEVVIEGDVGTQFTVTPTGGAINVALTLARESVQTTLAIAVKPRN